MSSNKASQATFAIAMEAKTTTVLTISDLIQSGRPLTAAASLVPSRPIHPRKSSNQNPCCRQNPNDQTLKSLNHPALLMGTVTLPSYDNCSSPLKCNCFQFSDDVSTSICCEILDFDPRLIGQKIRILAWNFIPFECGNRDVKGGFLEIITWDFFQDCCGSPCSLSDFSRFCLSLGACEVGDSFIPRCLIFGVIESISPVSVVPWATGGGDSRSISGFLVRVLVCHCKYCASKKELRGLCERNVKDHCFNESAIVYFCGLPSSWHPLISRLNGDVVLLTGLKKKLVFLRKEVSQLMYLTTDATSLHVTKLSKDLCLTKNINIRGKWEYGSYTGAVTGVYMNRMILELDQDVILIFTDQHLALPHYVRVGVLVTLKNVHFVDPKFPWAKMLILGACTRTSMHLESFSPLESWLWLLYVNAIEECHLKKHSPSLLQKFIDSLSFAARLWALLVVFCFRKMFTGILSEKEILGSKHSKSKLMSTNTRCSQKEGLAQKYASSHLPLSAFQIRHGVLLEFCRHDLCSCGKEVDCGQLRLVLPIANLVSYCEVSWKKVLNSQENCPDFMGEINQNNPLCCGGRSYAQSIRRVLHSEEIGVVVLGTLKVSSSGRLQLVDATGSVDSVLSLSETWEFKRIFEVKDFRLIMEGTCPELEALNSIIYEHLSCRQIFSNALPVRKLKTTIYLFHCPSDEDSKSPSPFFDWNGITQDFDSGKYHLLWLTHKFPIQQKFVGDLAKRPNMFAEAIVLPWDLLVAGKYRDEIRARSSSGHWKDSFKKFTGSKKDITLNRCKNEHTAVQVSSCISHSNSYAENRCSNNQLEMSCLKNGEGVNSHWMGMLHCISERSEVVSYCKSPRRKVLLEFGPDCFFKYELLKIGCCYLVKHEEGDILCCKEENYQVSRAKVSISSGTFFRSFTLSSIQGLQSADLSDGFPFCDLNVSSDEGTKDFCQFEIPCLIGNRMSCENYADIIIFVPSSALNLLGNFMKIFDGNPDQPKDSFEEESRIHDHSGSMINASMHSSGTICSDYPLPQGNLITLHGLVLALHDCHGVDFLAQPGRCSAEGSKLMLLQENAGFCVHVFVDNHTVRIFCDRSKETCPIGLGRDAYATFHRVLILGELDKYMMTAVSFITIDHSRLMRRHLSHELSDAFRTVRSQGVSTQDTVSIALISEALQLSELRPMRFRCKVVALYILVLEKSGSTSIFQSCSQPIRSAFGIPFAGFIIDDGSSSCCCWVDSERAAAFIGLNFEEQTIEETGKEQLHISIVGRLNQVLEKHGRISVKNCGSMFDSSCHDLEFSVNSNKLISSSDEDVLQSLFSSAFSSTSWTVDGSLMDPKTMTWLEQRLAERDVAVPPLLNVWATRVCRTDTLAEARNIIQELL